MNLFKKILTFIYLFNSPNLKRIKQAINRTENHRVRVAANEQRTGEEMTKTEETEVSVLVSLFNWIQKTKPAAKKRSKFRKFLDTYCDSVDYFSALRLILPSLDRERGSYGLKESVLANCLIDALGMSKDSADAVRLINWRKGGAAPNAGNFPMVAAEVCFVFRHASKHKKKKKSLETCFIRRFYLK